MFKKIFFTVLVLIIVGTVLFFAIDGSAKKDEGYKTVVVEKGSIIDKALAVGKIEPKQEISVKSKIPGIVNKIFVEVGDKVDVGDALFDIAPDPTPIELTQAKREVEIHQVAFDNAQREFDRIKALKERNHATPQEYDQKETAYEDARLRLELAKEKLSLIEKGRSSMSDDNVDNIIKSPISGTVLSRLVEEGDPIVPLTSYQAGTELMTLAKMDDLVFKGNVDEIDVGRLKTGMEVEIEIGAFASGNKLTGKLTKISPKAHKEEGSTLFEVEIEIDPGNDSYLRAGYSANADVIITKREDIVLIPERLIHIKDSASYVEVVDTMDVISEREIHTGLSDGINIEVTDGLQVDEKVVERPPKEIQVWD